MINKRNAMIPHYGIMNMLSLADSNVSLLDLCLQIDSVDRPSWQAQLSGQKTWSLIPPPECEHVCPPILAATMNKGEVSKSTSVYYGTSYFWGLSLKAVTPVMAKFIWFDVTAGVNLTKELLTIILVRVKHLNQRVVQNLLMSQPCNTK